MTEEKGQYNVTPKPGVIRQSCFLEYDKGWTQPTPEEVRELARRLDMNGSEIANFVGASSSRSVRRWMSDVGQPNHREISYAIWRLLVERYARQLTDEPLILEVAETVRPYLGWK